MSEKGWTTGQVAIIVILAILFSGVVWKLLWGLLHFAVNVLIIVIFVAGAVWLVRTLFGAKG